MSEAGGLKSSGKAAPVRRRSTQTLRLYCRRACRVDGSWPVCGLIAQRIGSASNGQALNASLIAGQAFQGVFRMSLPGVFQKIGIGQMLSGHGNQIGISPRDHFIHDIGIDITPDGNDGNSSSLL